MKCLVVTVFSVLLVTSLLHAETYKWVDRDGVVHFTDDPDRIPGKYLPKVEKLPSVQESPKSPGKSPQATPAPAAPVAEEPAGPPVYGGADEKEWQSRFRQLRSELKSLQDGLQVKKDELVKLRRKYTIDRYSRNRVAYYGMMEQIEKDEARITELQNKLVELDLEASRFAVPLDWRK